MANNIREDVTPLVPQVIEFKPRSEGVTAFIKSRLMLRNGVSIEPFTFSPRQKQFFEKYTRLAEAVEKGHRIYLLKGQRYDRTWMRLVEQYFEWIRKLPHNSPKPFGIPPASGALLGDAGNASSELVKISKNDNPRDFQQYHSLAFYKAPYAVSLQNLLIEYPNNSRNRNGGT